MRFEEFKTNFVNKVYIPYMNGDKGASRTALANIYRQGKDTPRATLYQVHSSINTCIDVYKSAINELKQAGKTDQVGMIAINNLKFSKELSKPHPLVTSALDELTKNLAKQYPSKKSAQALKFVIYKQHFPILNKFKFLTRFF